MRVPVEIRVLTKFERRGDDECWPWLAAKASGYGVIWGALGRRAGYAHRLLYTMMVGPIPDGLTLDHLCHNRDDTCLGGPTCPHRGCVNPRHLQPCSPGENASRSRNAPYNIKARQTHCLRGHELPARSGGARRNCLACGRSYYWRKKAAEQVSA